MKLAAAALIPLLVGAHIDIHLKPDKLTMKHLASLLLVGLLASPALAGSVTSTLPITVQAPLAIVFTPASPTIPCSAPAGTVVSALSLTGGDGNTPTWGIAGDTTDFALSGANIVVGTNAIASADCGKTNNVSITATQP
jgi:hypothetical protein